MPDNRTLDEIKQDDIGMLGDILKNAKEYRFTTEAECMAFQGDCLFKTLGKLGLPMNEKMDQKMVDRIIKTKGIRVERRRYTDEIDLERTGFYVYKEHENGDEMVTFISDPVREEFGYLVRTDVRI